LPNFSLPSGPPKNEINEHLGLTGIWQGSKDMAKNNGNGRGGLAVGLSVAAIAAAAAGAYFFYGPNGAKNRKNLRAWTVKARGEVMESVEKLRDVSEKTYNQTVDKVMSKYKKLKNVAPKEIAAVTRELKSSWKAVKSEMDKAAKNMK
jgi:hypothetical protein